jgi:hypothetical protein
VRVSEIKPVSSPDPLPPANSFSNHKEILPVPGTFTSISIFAFDLDERGDPIQAWETVVDDTETETVDHAKELAKRHAGVLVVRREGRRAVGEEGDPIIVFQTRRIGDFD